MRDMTSSDSGDAGSQRRAAVDLFLISFLILFLELAAIRWFGSMVVFLTFFTNIVLLASFLGMSVGCLAASRRENLVDRAIPLLAAGAQGGRGAGAHRVERPCRGSN